MNTVAWQPHFLEAGAGGVIAALWNVDDAAAKNVALDFYANSEELESGASQFMRKVRAGFDASASASTSRASSLLLAYQFFGHPRMRLDMQIDTGD